MRKQPHIERQLEQIAADADAGLLTPDEALDRMIAANCAWAQRFLTAKQLVELELYLRELSTHPVLLKMMGRAAH